MKKEKLNWRKKKDELSSAACLSFPDSARSTLFSTSLLLKLKGKGSSCLIQIMFKKSHKAKHGMNISTK